MIPAPAVKPIAVTEESIAMVVGSVLWIRIPVSPVIPLTIIEVVLPVGGTMVQAVTVVPPVGTVMVLKPEDRVFISTDPGDAALEAAVRVSVPETSPLYVIVVVLNAVTAKSHL